MDGPIPNEVTEEYRYLPFGGGKRKCIGEQFALFESIVALALLVKNFDLELDTSKGEVGMTTGEGGGGARGAGQGQDGTSNHLSPPWYHPGTNCF